MVTRQILKLTCTPEIHVFRVYSEKVQIHVYFFKNSVYFGVFPSLAAPEDSPDPIGQEPGSTSSQLPSLHSNAGFSPEVGSAQMQRCDHGVELKKFFRAPHSFLSSWAQSGAYLSRLSKLGRGTQRLCSQVGLQTAPCARDGQNELAIGIPR